jgi:exonuclease I
MYPFYNEQLDLTDYDIDRIVARYGSRQWAHPAHYDRMKNWIKYRIRRFDYVPSSSQEVEKLRGNLQFAKSELDKKNVIIMEQMKVIMDLAKKIK